MQRILVMGASGSGKSTFSRRLSAVTGIPVVSVDALFWKPGWVESGKAEFHERLTAAALQPSWIMDGNFTSHLVELRRDACDTLIWFDLPRATCMMGILARIARSYGQVRPEMAEGCPEKIDLAFFHYVWTFREKIRPKLLSYFEGLRPDQTFVTFTRRAQADRYLNNLSAPRRPARLH